MGATARHMPSGIVNFAIPEPQLGPPIAVFEREGAPPVSLFSGYRNMIKRSWVNQWWPTTCLLTVWSRAHPAEVEPLVRELTTSRTLARPVADFAVAALELQRAFPEYLHVSGRWDDALGCSVVEPIPGEDELCACAAEYRALAGEIDDLLTRRGVRLAGARVLDLGCGTGYLGAALAGLGAGEVIGVDRDLGMAADESARGRMMELLAGDRAEVVSIRPGDAHALPFAAHEFDLVVSSTAVEHFSHLETVVAETARVLLPGGFAYHGVEPWFSRRGGHALCTLDFPWGHVRVTPQEFERYVELLRPHEAADAVAYFHQGFQTPRLTLDLSRRIFQEAFQILEWREKPLPARDPHRRLLDARVLDDCRRVHSGVTRRDLLTTAYAVLGQTALDS